MSNKAFFKRVALAAIASLGFGMLSVSPSVAAVANHTLTIDAAADDAKVGETATAVLTQNWTKLDQYDSVTIQAVVTSSNSASAGTLMLVLSESSTSTAATFPTFSNDTATTGADINQTLISPNPSNAKTVVTFGNPGDSTARGINAKWSLRLVNISAAGTYTVSVLTRTSDNGATKVIATPAVTWTVTVTDQDRSATAASTVTVRTAEAGSLNQASGYFAGTREGTDSNTLTAATSSATDLTPEFSLVVKQKLGSGTNTARESYTVTVSGEAFVTAGTGLDGAAVAAATSRPIATSGGVKSVRMPTPVADSPTLVRVWSTGTAGTATVTVTTDGGVVLGTKTFTFHGTIAGLEKVTTYKNVIRAGTNAGSVSVISLKAVDSGGRAVTGRSIAGVSSNVAAIASGTCTDAITYAGVATDASTADGVYLCDLTQSASSVSGAAAAITWRTLKYLSTTEYWTVTQDVKMGGAATTWTIATDKATYEPGEKMVITVTAKDASGNTPYDLQAGPTLRMNKQYGGTLSMSSFLGGVSTSVSRDDDGTILDGNNLFAPAASGKFIITGTDALDATVTATATVGDDAATAAASAATDAALEAIDAANAATDAANLAAEAADAATVAAEEARDAADAATAAVEALATEVATLMAALKAQITTLANTVAKIAKKVKA